MRTAYLQLVRLLRGSLSRTNELWARVRSNGDLTRVWLVCVAFALSATGFAYAHSLLAWGSYVRANTLRLFAVPALFGALYLEFAVIGVVTVWSYRRRWQRGLTLCALFIVLFVNSVQLVSTTISNEFITPPVLRLIGLVGGLVSSQSVATVGFGSVLGLTVLWAALGMTSWQSTPVSTRQLATLLMAGWGLLLFASGLLTPVRKLRARHGLRPEAPVLSLARATREAIWDGELNASAPNAEELRLALDAGLYIDPSAVAPFRKDWIYERPLPFARREPAPQHPNLIVLFFESWSAEVLGPYNPRWRELTPNLNDFARDALRVDDYVNHAIPTVTGLRGQLCSMFPGLAYTPWRDVQKPVVSQVLCLPTLLEQAGYESMYLNHGPAHATHFDSQAIDWGFERAYFVDGVVGDLLKGEKPEYKGVDATDEQVMRATIALLERLRARPRSASRPLFLAVSTYQTHTGIDVARKFGDGKNPVLNTFGNLDAAFGTFWRWYQHSPWTRDTILILTGDHTLYPHDAFREVATARHLDDRFGYMGLFIRDPTHALPASYSVRSTSIDFAPTVVQLLDLPSRQANAFMGLSMFSDRQHTPIALGFNYGRDVLLWERARATPQIYHSPARGVARQLFDVLRYEQQLERDRRIWFR